MGRVVTFEGPREVGIREYEDPALDHRWSVEQLENTVMALAAEGEVSLEPLVTHVFEVDEAERAFQLLDQRPAPEEVVQAVIEF